MGTGPTLLVLSKLLIAVVSTILLLLHMRAATRLAGSAEPLFGDGDLTRLRIQLTADAGAALLALIVATALAIYKPRGMTAYGARKERRNTASAPLWWKLLVAAVVLFLVAMRLFTHGGMHSPGSG